ncbi:MAG: hypothetical protein QG641_2622 [Candidatus Poribacteria bacterium]|nr:hypothetical protein [Candidatus Poribacteria bacterium]
MKMTKKDWHWLELVVACVTYVAANAVDYMLTIYGLTNTTADEANLFAQSYMKIFGMLDGLLIYKFLMIIIVLVSIIALDYTLILRKIKFRTEYILYAGAGLTVLASSL